MILTIKKSWELIKKNKTAEIEMIAKNMGAEAFVLELKNSNSEMIPNYVDYKTKKIFQGKSAITVIYERRI